MPDGGSIVGLDFDNSRQAWPAYDWMGVAKAGLEATSRYLAKTLGPQGVRVNLVAAGPIRTVAAKSIPAFAHFEDVWNDRAPLGWVVRRHHGAPEERAHRFNQLGRRRAIVRRGAHGRSFNRSCSFSHTRRPIAASSTDRENPTRWADACMMHITPHFSVPSTSHQCTACGSTSTPDAAP